MTNIFTLVKRCAALTDINAHTESLLELEGLGIADPATFDQLREIKTAHEKAGHMPPDLYERRAIIAAYLFEQIAKAGARGIFTIEFAHDLKGAF